MQMVLQRTDASSLKRQPGHPSPSRRHARVVSAHNVYGAAAVCPVVMACYSAQKMRRNSLLKDFGWAD
jgi:hypothetical protein